MKKAQLDLHFSPEEEELIKSLEGKRKTSGRYGIIRRAMYMGRPTERDDYPCCCVVGMGRYINETAKPRKDYIK